MLQDCSCRIAFDFLWGLFPYWDPPENYCKEPIINSAGLYCKPGTARCCFVGDNCFYCGWILCEFNSKNSSSDECKEISKKIKTKDPKLWHCMQWDDECDINKDILDILNYPYCHDKEKGEIDVNASICDE